MTTLKSSKKVERNLLVSEQKIVGDTNDFRSLVKKITGASEEVVENFLLNFDSSRVNTICLMDLFEFGFTKRASEKLLNAFQFAVRLSQASIPDLYTVRSPEDLYELARYLKFYEQEVFLVIALDTKNRVIAKKEIFVGSLSSSIVHPREVFRFALQHSASSIVVSHQHPSGDPTPSKEDIDVTRRLCEAGKYMGITVLDHIIVGDQRYVSLKEKGYI